MLVGTKILNNSTYVKFQIVLFMKKVEFTWSKNNFTIRKRRKLTGVTYPKTGFLKFLVDTSWWYVAWYFKISFTYGVSETSFRSRTLFFLGPSCGFTPFWPFLSEGGDSVAKQTLRTNKTWSSVLIHLIFHYH